MSSKSSGANYGAKRIVKAVAPVMWMKPPKGKKPIGWGDENDPSSPNYKYRRKGS